MPTRFAFGVLSLISARFTHLVAAILTLTCFSGCSLLIRHSGTTLDNLDSRAAVEEIFGPSTDIVAVDLLEPSTQEAQRFEVENYHIHRKFNTEMGMGAWSPFLLLYEPMWTCSELYGAAKEVAVGHDLAFVYDQHGKAIGHQYPRKFLSRMQDRSENVLDWEEVSQ